MKTIIFDGKAFARKIEDELYHKIERLPKRPMMVTILVGEDPASKLYVKLKTEAAERIGAQMDVYEYPADIKVEDLIAKINHLNADKTLDGIMIQLPLPDHLKDETEHIVNHISKEKDVDGMREDSPFMPATVRAVISILDEAKKKIEIHPDSYIVVVGAKGEVGSRLVEFLSRYDYEVGALDKDTDLETFVKELLSARVIISASGSVGVIKKDYVREGTVIIDVGSPKGDCELDVRTKAGFITPVPGGVGPVTVVSLLENLVEASA